MSIKLRRFRVRNKEKIIEAFDKEYYDNLILSLEKLFSIEKEIEEHEYEGERFKVIHAPNAQENTDSYFEFYLISKTYNVYRLAYKSCCG